MKRTYCDVCGGSGYGETLTEWGVMHIAIAADPAVLPVGLNLDLCPPCCQLLKDSEALRVRIFDGLNGITRADRNDKLRRLTFDARTLRMIQAEDARARLVAKDAARFIEEQVLGGATHMMIEIVDFDEVPR